MVDHQKVNHPFQSYAHDFKRMTTPLVMKGFKVWSTLMQLNNGNWVARMKMKTHV
jgi:hypothetical protein